MGDTLACYEIFEPFEGNVYKLKPGHLFTYSIGFCFIEVYPRIYEVWTFVQNYRTQLTFFFDFAFVCSEER